MTTIEFLKFKLRFTIADYYPAFSNKEKKVGNHSSGLRDLGVLYIYIYYINRETNEENENNPRIAVCGIGV